MCDNCNAHSSLMQFYNGRYKHTLSKPPEQTVMKQFNAVVYPYYHVPWQHFSYAQFILYFISQIDKSLLEARCFMMPEWSIFICGHHSLQCIILSKVFMFPHLIPLSNDLILQLLVHLYIIIDGCMISTYQIDLFPLIKVHLQ